MKFRAVIALFALVAPAFAQHGGAHGGSFGSRGSTGHAGFSGSPGFSRSGSFIRPAAPVRYGAPGSVGFRGIGPAPYSARPAYGSMGAAQSRAWDRNGDRNGNQDRDRFDARRRSFNNWYSYYYPNLLGYGYPYVIDPGFYDWGEPDDSETGNSAYDQTGMAPEPMPPYPDEGYATPDEYPQQGYAGELPPWVPPGQNQAFAAPAAPSAPAPEEPLTVIFKSGRAPVKMQNYMMTGKFLTDLDSRHYEQIPLDQIDVAATQRANVAAGLVFQIPNDSRD